MKERTRERACPASSWARGAQEPLGLSFRNASLREVYQALGKAAGVNFVFDPQFQDQPITLDLRDVPLRAGPQRPRQRGPHLPPRRWTRAWSWSCPTRRPSAASYEQQVVKTFFLSNADLKETIDLLRIVLGARRVAPLPGRERAHHQRHAGQGGGGGAHRRHRGQAAGGGRGRGRDPGGQPHAAQGVRHRDHVRRRRNGIAGAIFPREHDHGDGDGRRRQPVFDRDAAAHPRRQPLQAPRTCSSPACPASSTGCSRATPRRASWPTRSCARWRARPRRPASATRCRCPVTVFSPIATGGVAQQPVTSFEYKNVGRQHRHHAARAPRRRGDAGPEAGDLVRWAPLLPEPAHLQQPHRARA